jgi:uncharacterized protein with HEPN domain
MPSPDADRLRHMRDAAASALEMTAGHERPDLTANTMLAMALTRCLEIVGEAASRVTPETRGRFPAIPFAKIVSMRNRLIHAYFDVDLDIVWTTVTEDLPGLLFALDAALADIAIS